MSERKIVCEEDLMIDFAEMTSFDFDSLDYKQIQELHKITEYDNKPSSFKFGKHDLIDLFKYYESVSC